LNVRARACDRRRRATRRRYDDDDDAGDGIRELLSGHDATAAADGDGNDGDGGEDGEDGRKVGSRGACACCEVFCAQATRGALSRHVRTGRLGVSDEWM